MPSFLRSLAVVTFVAATACRPSTPPARPAAPDPAGTLVLRVFAVRTAPEPVPLAAARAFLVDPSTPPRKSDPHLGWPAAPRRVAPAVTYVTDSTGVIRIHGVPAGQRAVFVSAMGRTPAIVAVQVRAQVTDTLDVSLDIVGCNCP